MVDLLYHLTSLLFFNIPLLCYYFNLRSSIFYLSFGDIFCGDVFETCVIFSAILFPIKSPVASAVFLIALFEAVLSASVADRLDFYLIFTWLSFYLYFYPYF